jgi:hypothetical protein
MIRQNQAIKTRINSEVSGNENGWILLKANKALTL